MRLLKWFFTMLAFLWLYQVIRQAIFPPKPRQPLRPPSPPPPAPRPTGEVTLEKRSADKGEGDYIDYEEIK